MLPMHGKSAGLGLGLSWYPRDSVGFPELHHDFQELTSSRLHASRFFFAAQDPQDDHVYHVGKPAETQDVWKALDFTKKKCQHKDDLRYRTFLNLWKRPLIFGSFPSYIILIHEVFQWWDFLLKVTPVDSLMGPGSPIEPLVFQEDEDPEIIREKARRVSRENNKKGVILIG